MADRDVHEPDRTSQDVDPPMASTPPPTPTPTAAAPSVASNEDDDDDGLEDAYGYSRSDLLFGGNWWTNPTEKDPTSGGSHTQQIASATLTVGSFFSGIGGLDLGLERAGMQVIWQSEIDPYACRVLARHWPTVPNLGDITTIDWSTVERPDLVCGGYPCPAFSQTARGRNVAPDLWPYMRDAIAVLRPRWVLLENVASHLGRGFPAVLADLDALGFDAEWSVVSACSVGASHTRRRLFCVAHAYREGEPTFPFDGEMAWVPAVAEIGGRWGFPTADDARADDGVPHRLDRDRALGNAVVPPIAELIGRRIAAIDRAVRHAA